MRPRDLGDGATLLPLVGAAAPPPPVAPDTPSPWSRDEEKALLKAVKAFQARKKAAAAAGDASLRISWSATAKDVSAATGAPLRTKADVKAHFAEVKARIAAKRQAGEPSPSKPAAAPAPVPAPSSAPELPEFGSALAGAGGSWGDGLKSLVQGGGGTLAAAAAPASSAQTGSAAPSGGESSAFAAPAAQAPAPAVHASGFVEEDFDGETPDGQYSGPPEGAVGAAAHAQPSSAQRQQQQAPVRSCVSLQEAAALGGGPIPPALLQACQELLHGIPQPDAPGTKLKSGVPVLRQLNAAWMRQGVQVDPHAGLGFGFLQHEGGPCGALASLQATALQHLYFRSTPLRGPEREGPEARRWEGAVQALQGQGQAAGRGATFSALAGRKAPSAGRGAAIPDAAWAAPPAPLAAEAVLAAFADIVWRAAVAGDEDEPMAVLALPGPQSGGAGEGARAKPALTAASRQLVHAAPTSVERSLVLVPATSHSALLGLLHDWADVLLQPQAPTLVCLVYSAMLSRGLGVPAAAGLDTGELVFRATGGSEGGLLQDMDGGLGAEAKLVGAHNYATQELVNLLLTGRATSNVHDGVKSLGEGAQATQLTGVSAQAQVGFLTLFEHYGYMRVGENLKQPRFPIWVVCSESHYSTLFALPIVATGGCTPAEWWAALAGAPASDTSILEAAVAAGQRLAGGSLAGGSVDLAYYDGLGGQDACIHLTAYVDEDGEAVPAQAAGAGPKVFTAGAVLGAAVAHTDDMDSPPLDRVLRTRWPHAAVDWNGSEPLL